MSWIDVAAALLALAAGSAHAALGERADRLAGEAGRMGALHRAASGTQPHVETWADGSQVRQYMGADGVVYAVAWNTRGKPPLATLLGAFHRDYVAAVQREMAARPGIRHAGRWQAGDLVVEASAHGNAFVGRAYLRSRMPQGQGADAVR